MTSKSTAYLIHGGLWAEQDAERFWHRPGITAGLATAGIRVLAPDRPPRPPDWATEARELANSLPAEPVVVVAGSNGCSAAVRLATDAPGRVRTLVLGWPATAGDPEVDARDRDRLIRLGAAGRTADRLLAGGTLRGVDDADLAGLAMPVAVLPSLRENPPHQRRTVDALLRLVPGAVEVPGSPEPPRPDFTEHRACVVATLLDLIS